MQPVMEFLRSLANSGVRLSVEAGQLSCYTPRALAPADKEGLARYKTQIISLLQSGETRIAAPAEPEEEVYEFPLSSGQKGLYILQQMYPNMGAYNIPIAWRMHGPIDEQKLRRAWDCVLQRHPILTARVSEKAGEPYQILERRCRSTVQAHSLEAMEQPQLLEFLRERARRPFDLQQGPLTRVDLFRLGAQQSVFLLTVHHIVFDGVSSVVLVKDLLGFYERLCAGRRVAVEAAPPAYQSFVAHERALLASVEGQSHADYWRDQLQGDLQPLQLSADAARQTLPRFDGRTFAAELPRQLADWINELAAASLQPPSVILFALFHVLLRKYTERADFIIGMPVMGREEQQFVAEIGYFVNVLPLRLQCREEQSLGDVLVEAQRVMLEALYHSSYPMPKMLEHIKAARDGVNPLFQVSYAYQQFINEGTLETLPGRQRLQIEHLDELTQEGDFDLGLEVFEKGSSFLLHWKYNTHSFSAERVEELHRRYCLLIDAACTDRERPLSEYSIVTDEERIRLLLQFNATGTAFEPVNGIPALFAAQVERTPEAVAAVYGQERLSYRQLHERSQQLARYLCAQGVTAEQLVGVCLPRSLSLLVAVLGVMQAGGAYVPLDPEYPAERSSYMVRDSGARIVLTVSALREKLAGLVPAGVQLICLDELEAAPASSALPPVQPDQLAYVIYTSGSTGQPKGVMIEHRSAVTLIQWAQQLYSAQELSGVLAATSVCFDLSVFEMFVPLAVGGTVILVNNVLELTQLDSPVPVSLINTVPSAMQELLELGALASSVQTVNLAGEPLEPALVDRIYASGPVGKVYDLYGPSEDTTYSTYMLRERAGRRSIGRPIANTQVYILDTRRQLQPLGVAGELYIGGAGLARGYLGKEELTGERFVENPFQAGSRLYRTGDLARWCEDGTLEYLGRIDTQVKIRGFRIETGEIEARLNQHAGVAESVVVAQGTGSEKRLVAFYRVREEQGKLAASIAAEELRAHLQTSLPGYMVPAIFVSVPVIPLTPNGKVDRRSLERREVSAESTRAYVAARTPLESELTRIWSQVLKLDPARIGVRDDFFELGGHSLLATQLVSQVRSRLQVELPLRDLFQNTTIERQASLLGQLPGAELPRITPVQRDGRLPLSYAQERLWFIDQLDPESHGYNEVLAVRLHGNLSVADLQSALNQLIERHEALRTVFPSEAGKPWQHILPVATVQLAVEDLRELSGAAQMERLRLDCESEARRRFDLARGPLLYAWVLRLADAEQVVILNLHHIICDGWSLGIVMRDLAQIIGGQPLAPLPVQYADYSLWQRQWLEGARLETQLQYWRETLQGLNGSLELGGDYPRPPVQSFAGSSHIFTIGSALTQQLRQLGEEVGATLYMTLLAAFKVLLWKHSGQQDICVGSPIANRQYGETEGLVGMFVNTLALRTQVSGEDSFRRLLERVRRTCLAAYENQDAPFEKVVEAVRPPRDTGISPLFQVMLVLQNAQGDGSYPEGVEPYELARQISKFDLTLELTEHGGGLECLIEYSTSLYREPRIVRIAEHFVGLCAALVAAADQPIGELEYVNAVERTRLLEQFNATEIVYPTVSSIQELFTAQVARTPQAIAAVYQQESLTYQQLHERSHELARYLRTQGIEADQLVGVCLPRSLQLLVCVLGVLQAGGAYVPLDPEYPLERLSFMVRDSRARIVLTQTALGEKLAGLVPPETRLIYVDQAWENTSPTLTAPLPTIRPDQLAYVIYTSGSTGQPKGVMVEHRSLINHNYYARAQYGIGPGDTQLQFSTISFDLFAEEVFVALNSGAQLVLDDKENLLQTGYLERLIRARHITALNLPTAFFGHLAAIELDLSGIRTVIVGGEELTRDKVAAFFSKWPGIRLFNTYGPTETTIISTATVVTRELAGDSARIPIGGPIANTKLYVLDVQRRLQPLGVAGELYISGAGLARGYLGREELTRARFVDNPFHAGTRMYRTGDLARWRDDGALEYLGRIDTQLKIRGFRVEAGEIEALLNQHAEVDESVVVAQGTGSEKRLVAFYRMKTGTPSGSLAADLPGVPVEELRAHLQARLPGYMIPAVFVSVAAIPLTPNGKIDRRALERREVSAPSSHAHAGARSPLESELIQIWSQILKWPPARVGIHDDFFDLGGHSLLATQLVSQVRSRFQVELPLRELFQHSTIATLGEAIGRLPRTDMPRITRGQHGERPPLSYAQERLWFIDQLEPGGAGYNVLAAARLRGSLSVEALQSALNQLIERHEALRTVFPSEGGQPWQQIQPELCIRLEQEDLQGLSTELQSEQVRLACRSEDERGFDLANGPLLRGRVLQLAAGDQVLILNLHHIICDGWSLGILVSELGSLLRAQRQGVRMDWAPLPIQYVDYSVRQREWLQGARLEKQLQYWRDKLQGMTGSLEIGSDYPQPAVQSFAGSSHAFAIGSDLTQRLRQLGERAGGTLYMVLLSAFNVLLWKYSGQEDVCVGSPIANRQYGETEGLIGMFVNTLALRTRVNPQDTFVQLLEQVKQTCLEAYENQDAPFEKVVDAVKPQRDLGISPLFQVMLILQNVQGEGSYPEGVEPYELARRVSKFDLTLELTERGGGLDCLIEYSTSLYRAERIARLAEHFVGLCTEVVAEADRPIGEVECLGSAERTQLVERFNATGMQFEPVSGIPALFAAQVERTPEAVAAVYGQERVSYQQLYERSQQLARYLCAQGVAADQLVGVCLPRSLSLLVAVLGVMQAGGAYVPLDPEYPAERSSYMVRDSGARIVLTVSALREKLAGLVPAGAQLICLDELEPAPASSALPPVQPDQLAYVIYTSGSTGQPKGVMIEHRSAVTLIQWAQQLYSAQELSGVLAATSVCFDLSVFEMFVPLAVGGTVILVNNVLELTQLDSPVPVSLINTVPSAMQELLELGALASSVQTVNLAGEPLEPALVDRIYASGPVGKVYDLYGPSEDTTYSTYMLRERAGRRSIGRPIANTQVYILDTQRQLQPLGVAGELYIGGAGLARGYLGKEELTRERFVENPFQAGSRLYRTGDLARWSEEGTLEYLGRIDTQVKIRGFRIETGEIEARLNQHAGVAESVVVAQGTGSEKRLVAYYRMREEQAKLADGVAIAAEELRAHLQTSLPGYMVPAVFVSVSVIPLTPNGKVDRRSLERCEVSAESTRAYVAARTPLESELTRIWSQVLKLDPGRIGIHDDFFELGGHSLLATQLVAQVRSRLQVELPLRELFQHSTPAGQAGLIERLPRSAAPRIEPARRSGRLPLSYAQERLWFIDQLEPGSAGYNVLAAARLRGPLLADHLQSALNQLIERHEALRTIFPHEDGEPWQQVQATLQVQLEQDDLQGLSTEQQNDCVRLACESEGAKGFDLAHGPLLRGRLLRLASEDQVLVLNMHHIICDGWSLGILLRELGELLRGQQRGEHIELAPLPIQYADYSIWQREWLQGARLEAQLQYWRDKLQGLNGSLELGSDYPRPAIQSFAGSSHPFALAADLTQQLRQLGEQVGATLYMVLLSVFKVLLWRYSGQEDICVGSPIANRQYGEVEGLIGMFVNTLTLRSQVTAADTFRELLEKVKRTCLEAYENQDAPFEKVVEAVKPQRDMGVSPLFQVMLVLQNAPGDGEVLSGVEPYELDWRISKFDLTMELTEYSGGGLSGVIEYSTGLYRSERITRLAEHFVELCRVVASATDRPIGLLEYVGGAERTRLLEEFNATSSSYPPIESWHDLFAAQVEHTPQALAVVCGQESLSYRQLYERSRELASCLQALGVAADQLVGICLPRSSSLPVAVLGVLQAGGAYVPLDPEYPAERLSYMVRDSGARIVLTQGALRERLSGLVPPDTQLICVDEPWDQGVSGTSRALPATRPDQLAYVIYTSGSTGQPKGAGVYWCGLYNLLQWYRECLPIRPADRMLVLSSFSFDLTQKNLLAPLLSGAQVHLGIEPFEPAVLLRTICQEAITQINLTPSAFYSIMELDEGEQLASLRQAVLGGEPIDIQRLVPVLQRYPELGVLNSYGPTECADVCAYHSLTPEQRRGAGPIPIGRPVPNTRMYVLDEACHLVPQGVAGEIHVGGVGVGSGYRNRDALTAERFLADPFTGHGGMYKTGDLGRWRADGTMEYLGRIDTQVKIRGFRIETGEIEARLNQHAQIEESVVVAQGELGAKRLVAFYRSRNFQTQPSGVPAEELRAHLQSSLPGYMIPSVFVCVPSIPLTPNGKVDRRSLATREQTARSSRVHVPATTPTEQELVRICGQILKLDTAAIGIDDDFFELGGHSLLAVQLMARISRRFQQRLPLATLFTAPTVAQLARLIDADVTPTDGIVVPIQTGGKATPFFAIAGVGGNVLSLQPLSKALGREQPFYGLQARGLDGRVPPAQSVEETARLNISAMKIIQPLGPYRLIGHSYGGVVAYEMARILLEEEAATVSLTLLDSRAPAIMRERLSADELESLIEACNTLATLQGITLSLDARQLAALPREARYGYIATLLAAHDFAVDEYQLASFASVFAAQTQCYSRYEPRPLSVAIDVYLYRAILDQQHDHVTWADYGWNQLLSEPLRVVDLEAGHYSMLEGGCVEQFATQLLAR